MATHSSMLAWEIPWTEEPGGLQSLGLQSDMTWQLIEYYCSAYETPRLVAHWGSPAGM